MVVYSSDAHEAVWGLLLRKLRQEVNKPGSNAHKVSKRINVHNSTVYRWLDEKRGIKRPSLEKTLSILSSLDVPLEEILSEVMPEDVATILTIKAEDPSLFKKILRILQGDSRTKEKFISDVNYLTDDEDE
jgi:transcriptional regulator with XRE-family HTH domain